MHEVQERVEEIADYLESHAAEAEQEGRLPAETADKLREAGVIRMLQPKDYGGFESTPDEFFAAVMAVGARNPAAGWVSGVVGVHPWQLGQFPVKLQDELWGQDPDTWIASPYAPMGRAKPVEGGFEFTGRWPFSSGTDNCDWIILGGLLTDQDGNIANPTPRHFVLPREDYTIHHDSWDVVGLRGTGSKDVSVHGAFVPEYRVGLLEKFDHGVQAREVGRENPLYTIPFGSIFPAAINAGTLGMAEGALAAFVNYTRNRKTVHGAATSTDPAQLSALGEASADIAASRVHFLDDWKRVMDVVERGETLSDEFRLELRRNGVRAVRRAVDAVDRLFAHSGGGSLRLSQPMQRFWRDCHAGLVHICNVADPVYQAFGLKTFGHEPERQGW
ncbi:acyl-CoA dehydrogenase family protein [Geodermatophilus sp. SYSU D00079]